MSDSPTVDPTRCPLCEMPNACAMETGRRTGVAPGVCWCMTARFDEALLQRISADARGMACVCAPCAIPAERIG